MKRRDLIQRIGQAARDRGLTWELVRQGADHEVWALESHRITIPRHREIVEHTAGGDEGFRGGVRDPMVGDVKPTYTVIIEPDHGWWSIRVAELPGVFSQAKRLDRVEAMARDAIAMLLGVLPDTFDLIVREVLPPDVERAIASAREARADAAARQEVASVKSREAVRTLTSLGLPQRDIGRLLDLSHQRVGQLGRSTRPPIAGRGSVA